MAGSGGFNGFRIGFTMVVVGVMYWYFSKPYEPSGETRSKVEAALSAALTEDWRRFCVEAGPFPYEPGSTRIKDPESGYAIDAKCEKCDELVALGLLSKQEQQSDEDGYVRLKKIYDLTEGGRHLFHEDMRPVKRGMPTPGLCFAEKLALGKIVEVLSPQKDGGDRLIGLKFQARPVNPDGLLTDSRILTLGLKQALPGNPVLYAPEVTTVRFFAQTSLAPEVDGSVRVGKYALKDE